MVKGGLYFITKNGRHVLMYDGNEVGSFRAKKNSNGLVAAGNSLKLYGVNVAGSSLANPYLRVDGENAYFGETLLFSEGSCVNITAENYSSLLAGDAVPGYSMYSADTIYNIVDDVSQAPEITYSVSDGMLSFSTGVSVEVQQNLVYGNVNGVMDHNEEDPTATVDIIPLDGNNNPVGDMTTCPFVAVKYFDQVVSLGSSIRITYHVDTNDMARLSYDTVGTTFTVEIITSDTEPDILAGTAEPVRKTTYAGVFEVDTPVFNNAGQSWISIRCIDSNGVSSVTSYFDVLVKGDEVVNVYEMTEADINNPFTDHLGNTYTIVPNDDTVQYPSSDNGNTYAPSYKNKAALSAFFVWKKHQGYNKVILYNNPDDNNGQGTIYWVDLHPGNGFGTQTYYRFSWEQHYISWKQGSYTSGEDFDPDVNLEDDVTIIPSISEIEQWVDDYSDNSNPGRYWTSTRPTTNPPQAGQYYGGAVYFYFKHNGKKYYIEVNRRKQTGDDAQHNPVYEYYDYDQVTDVGETDRTTLPEGKSWINQQPPELGTPVVDPSLPWYIKRQYRYVVINTSVGDSTGTDCLTVPSEFTLDLNGATIAAAYCDDIKDSAVIFLNGNFDSHITNGNIVGNYSSTTLNRAAINAGEQAPCEHMGNIEADGTKFCSFSNIDDSRSVGYNWFFGYKSFYGATSMPLYSNLMSTGGINPETGAVDSTKTKMVVSSMITITQQIASQGELGLTKYGQRGYWGDFRPSGGDPIMFGRYREYFISFYDDSGTHIKTVKSKMHYCVKIPKYRNSQNQIVQATKCRISGYGNTRAWAYAEGNGPYILYKWHCISNKIQDCTIHDSRTAVIGGGEVSGKSYERCKFYNVAMESGRHKITPILGDLEDSWQETYFYNIKDCAVTGGGKRGIAIMYCQHFTFEGNDGISLENRGGFEDGFVLNNTNMGTYTIGRGIRSYNPHVLYKGNTLSSISLYTASGTTYDFLDTPLVMEDTTIINKSNYRLLKLKNSINGDELID